MKLRKKNCKKHPGAKHHVFGGKCVECAQEQRQKRETLPGATRFSGTCKKHPGTDRYRSGVCVECKREKARAARATKEGRARRMAVMANCRGRGRITYKDILSVWPKDDRCPVFGTPFSLDPARGRCDDTPSLDRIDSSAGYSAGNIQVISWRANVLKSNATADEMEALARWARREGCAEAEAHRVRVRAHDAAFKAKLDKRPRP